MGPVSNRLLQMRRSALTRAQRLERVDQVILRRRARPLSVTVRIEAGSRRFGRDYIGGGRCNAGSYHQLAGIAEIVAVIVQLQWSALR